MDSLHEDRKLAVDEYMTEEGIAKLFFSSAMIDNVLKNFTKKLVQCYPDTSKSLPNTKSLTLNQNIYPVASYIFNTTLPILVLSISLHSVSGTPIIMIAGQEVVIGNNAGPVLFIVPAATTLDVYNTVNGDGGSLYAVGVTI